jgi:DNA-binding NarL/FixJ family response regulator
MIRVAIVDDHPVVRRGLESLVREAAGMTVALSAESPARLLPDAPCDVVILDLYHEGDRPCLDSIAELSQLTRVLVISASGLPDDVVGAIRAGAMGYVTKHADVEMLLSAVRTVASGGFALFSHLADILRAELARGAVPPPAGRPDQVPPPRDGTLSPREDETLDLVARGLTHAQIARRMGVSKATVDTYIERIRAKLQVGNKAELTRAALQRAGGESVGRSRDSGR